MISTAHKIWWQSPVPLGFYGIKISPWQTSDREKTLIREHWFYITVREINWFTNTNTLKCIWFTAREPFKISKRWALQWFCDLYKFKLLNGKAKFPHFAEYKYCKNKSIAVASPPLEGKAQTPQLFEPPIWLKIHNSLGTPVSKQPCSPSPALLPDTTLSFPSLVPFPCGWGQGFLQQHLRVVPCPHTGHVCPVLGRRDSSQELQIPFPTVMEVQCLSSWHPEHELCSPFFPTTSREEIFLNDRSSSTTWISHAEKKPRCLPELLWSRLGNYFPIH